MSKKLILILAVILIIAGGLFYFLYKQQPRGNTGKNTTYPQSSNFTFYPIHEIKQNKFNSGTYNTEGYVVKIYTCPPCPKGALCKPCMRDNIIISENNNLLEAYSLSDKEMILFVNNPKQFELGKKYQFSIKILDYKSTGEQINDIDLIGYNSLSHNTPAGGPTNFNLVFKYGVGAKNELNTFEQTYTRDMVKDPPVTIKFKLSDSDLAGINQKISDLKLFDISQPTDGNMMVTPCSGYSLKVQIGSDEKEMSWSNCRGKINDKLQQFTEYIISIIESKEDYKKLPTPRGGYL